MSIEIKNITKNFGNFSALKNISLKIETGELVALLGPSGCGKTTLLRIISGLEAQDEGSILFSGEEVRDKKIGDRKVGFVFQHYALFKHMTVFENVAYGLKVQSRKNRPSKKDILEKVVSLLSLVRLENLKDRYPSQLSGGQRQRIALARALAVEPKVLLLDEPFGALDTQVRKELRRWLRKLHDEMHITSVFVTHDQEEALEVSDRVVVMNQGAIEQYGTPEEVYNKPATPFVYNFLGNVNLFHGRFEDGKLFLGNKELEDKFEDISGNRKANIYIRPHQFELTLVPNQETISKGRVDYINPAGSSVRIEVTDEFKHSILIEVTPERYKDLCIKKGDIVYLSPKDKAIFLSEEVQDFII